MTRQRRQRALEQRHQPDTSAAPTPAAAATNSTIVSVSSCAISCPRPAPTARRVAISRRRVAARASSMPATLLHAIASSAPVSANRKPMNARNGVRTGPGIRPIGAMLIV